MSEKTIKKTGPKTPEGKKRSSMNAIKHGLYATSRQAMDKLAEEVGIHFEETLEKMRDYFRPSDPLEEDLVRRIARCSWRLAQSEAMERRVTERNPAPGKPGQSYDKILRFERLVDIHMHRALTALMHKRQSENKINSQNESPLSSF